MPKLWKDTIDEHRREVRDAILDSTAGLVARHGLSGVTMSEVANEAGVGRATLYKYFPDVRTVLLAWHQRQVMSHLRELATVRARAGNAYERLSAVLEAYALMCHEHHGTELAASLHQGEHVAHAQKHLNAFLCELLEEGSRSGLLRGDMAPQELASYCLHALGAASQLASKDAVQRLVSLTLAALEPPKVVGGKGRGKRSLRHRRSATSAK